VFVDDAEVLVQPTVSREAIIIKFCNHLDTRNPPCLRLTHHYSELHLLFPWDALFCIQPLNLS